MKLRGHETAKTSTESVPSGTLENIKSPKMVMMADIMVTMQKDVPRFSIRRSLTSFIRKPTIQRANLETTVISRTKATGQAIASARRKAAMSAKAMDIRPMPMLTFTRDMKKAIMLTIIRVKTSSRLKAVESLGPCPPIFLGVDAGDTSRLKVGLY